MKGMVIPPDQGPAMQHMSPGRSVVLKLLSGQTDESLMMFEEATPAGTGTPVHLHHDSDEMTYVLKGEFAFKIGEEVTTGGPGTAHSYHEALRTLGRTLAPILAWRCSCIRRPMPENCSRN